MPGTKQGVIKRRATMIARAGSEAAYLEMQRKLAAKGGSAKVPKGTAMVDKDILQERARRLGLSNRGKKRT